MAVHVNMFDDRAEQSIEWAGLLKTQSCSTRKQKRDFKPRYPHVHADSSPGIKMPEDITAQIDISVAWRAGQALTHCSSEQFFFFFVSRGEVPLVSTVCPVENCSEAVPPGVIYGLPRVLLKD